MSREGVVLGVQQNMVEESRVALSLGSQGKWYTLKIRILLKQDNIKESRRSLKKESFTLISESAEIIKG